MKRRASVPIEQRSYGIYYAVFAGFLFLGTVWAVVDEVSTRRPWKETQREYKALAAAHVRERLDQAHAQFDSSAAADLSSQLAAARDSMNSPVYALLMRASDGVLEQLIRENRAYQFAKSRGDEAYYFYKKSVREGKEDPGEKEKLTRNEAEMAAHMALVTRLEASRDSIAAIVNVYKGRVRQAQNGLADLRKTIDLWEGKLNRVQSAPIEIKQVMLLGYDRNPFNDPKARIDRCQTCHLGWNEEVMEDAPEPFKNHPLPELLALHKPETFGCTPCHRGDGPSLTSGSAHGDADLFAENPLLRGKDVWASCNECHENESHLDGAPVFSSAKRLVIESGCAGCHEIKGYTELPRIGPDLGLVAGKATPDWIFRWVRNPKDYNPHTRMPNFRFTDDQAQAITAYLLHAAVKDTIRITRGAAAQGDRERGRKVFATVGGMACHALGDETKVREQRGTSYDIAPELTRVGSKVSADWIYEWVKDPRRLNPTTKMPKLRLTDQEARDVAAFLTTQRDPRVFESKALDAMSVAMVSRGEGLIREYGCAGCHAIPGMEKEGRVSVALSNFGRKRVDEMDYGDTKVPHTWHDWITNKLKDSRVFQTDRILQKMPVFSFSDDEIARIRLFLLSETKDEPDKRFLKPFDARLQAIETGRRLVYSYRCQQCHVLEQEGGHIGAIIEETAFLPPPLTGEGKKVQEQWLYAFLKNPSTVGHPDAVRFWLNTRMPTFSFTDDEIGRIMNYFLALSNQQMAIHDYQSFTPDPVLLPVGRSIFNDFQCIKCHPTNEKMPGPGSAATNDLAPNLTNVRSRLKPAWVVEWLADPNKLQEGTRMPSFFPDGQSPLPDVLGGDAQKQMTAIRDYVFTLGGPVRSNAAAR